jgi:hypothetical protein
MCPPIHAHVHRVDGRLVEMTRQRVHNGSFRCASASRCAHNLARSVAAFGSGRSSQQKPALAGRSPSEMTRCTVNRGVPRSLQGQFPWLHSSFSPLPAHNPPDDAPAGPALS